MRNAIAAPDALRLERADERVDAAAELLEREAALAIPDREAIREQGAGARQDVRNGEHGGVS